MKDNIHQSSGNIFLDLGFSAEEAASLLKRADLMETLRRLIEDRRWTPTETAERLGMGLSQVLDLLRGKPQKFDVDTLLSVAIRAGLPLPLSA